MKKQIVRYLSVALLLLVSVFVHAETARAVVETSANDLMSSLKAHRSELKSNPKLVHNLIEKHIIPVVDVKGMSRSVLGRKIWKNASTEQRKAFSHEFMQLIVRTYSQGVKNYSGETIKFSPERAGANKKRFVSVSSVILVPNGRRIPLKYRLVKKREGWKVYDISVEGVSLLQSYRNQFSQEFKKGTSLDQLIVKIRQNKIKKKS